VIVVGGITVDFEHGPSSVGWGHGKREP
jgi:hypothetical protein